MEVTVTDTSSNSVIIPVVIEIKPTNEFTPVFPADITVNVDEDTAVGSDIATHVATDGDSSDSPDGVITHSIQSGSLTVLLREQQQMEIVNNEKKMFSMTLVFLEQILFAKN
ncbi:hypothetical protein DPMN_004361 [Dreissena polymorpha]|uniref:Cadherin domain-containing protein n=1 Tax=Dreissena polymorpha TaxID=45954 RepID=A0A9D4MMP0_DREPO|nr:hypothetical protein DPMN_004361 [Dreissena polymorpha]